MALQNADHVQNAVAAQLKLVLPEDWEVYNRKDTELLNSDFRDRVAYVTNLPDIDLEVESDNRILAGYPIPVTLVLNELVQERDGTDLVAIRRECKQKLYTTNYPTLATLGLVVESIDIGDVHGEPVPGLREGFTTAELLVTIGIIEDRSDTP